MRYIGVDLHKTNFVVCFMSESETTHLETYPLTKTGIARFIHHLEPAGGLCCKNRFSDIIRLPCSLDNSAEV